MVRLLIALVWLLASGQALAARTLILEESLRDTRSLRAVQDILHDSSRTLILPDLIADHNRPWRALESPMIGMTNDAIWVRVNVYNNTSVPLDALLEERSPQNNWVELYVVKGGEVLDWQKSGDHVPLAQRAVPYRYPVFELRLPVGESTVYLRYESNDLVSTRLFLASSASFNHTREVEKLVYGLLLGILLIMPLYNVMLFFLLKNRSYLYYTVYGLLYVVFQGSVNGLIFQYGWDHPFVNDELSMFSAILTVVFVYRFIGHFLELPQRMPRAFRFMKHCERVSLVAAFLPFVHFASSIVIGLGCNIVVTLFLFYTSYVTARRGYRPAMFFLVAWIIFMIGDAFTLMGYLSVIDEGPLTQWGMILGATVEEVLVSIAMGYKFEEIRQALISSEIEKSKLIGSMESARIIQESLVSRNVRSSSLEVASYYRSAEQTGGDWFSIVDRPDQHIAVFALGDVTGHGLSSSMMTAFACGALEASVHSLDWSPAAMEESLRKLADTFNRMLFRTATSNDRLMTMSVFALDLVSCRGYYVNCGHHASYLLGRERLTPIFRRGSILGLQRENSTFPILSFTFAVGDSILLHSDGLVENTGPAGEHFPLHRVHPVLEHKRRAGENLQALIENAEAFWKGRQPDDDVTVLLIRIVAAAQAEQEGA